MIVKPRSIVLSSGALKAEEYRQILLAKHCTGTDNTREKKAARKVKSDEKQYK